LARKRIALGEAAPKRLIKKEILYPIPRGKENAKLPYPCGCRGERTNIAKTNNRVIVPANLADLARLVTAAMTVFKAQPR